MERHSFFQSYHLPLVALNPQQKSGEPPNFPKVGILHSPHHAGVGVGGSDFRGAFVRRRTLQRLLQEGLALRLATLHLPRQDVLQKLARAPSLLVNGGLLTGDMETSKGSA